MSVPHGPRRACQLQSDVKVTVEKKPVCASPVFTDSGTVSPSCAKNSQRGSPRPPRATGSHGAPSPHIWVPVDAQGSCQNAGAGAQGWGSPVLPVQPPHVQSDACGPLWPGGLGSGKGDSHRAWCVDFGEGTRDSPRDAGLTGQEQRGSWQEDGICERGAGQEALEVMLSPPQPLGHR